MPPGVHLEVACCEHVERLTGGGSTTQLGSALPVAIPAPSTLATATGGSTGGTG